MQNTEKNNSGVTFDTQSEASFGGSRYKRNYDNYKEISVKADAEKSRTEKNNFGTVISVVAFTALFLGLSLFVTNTILQTKGMSLFSFFDLQTEAVCETGAGSSAGKTDFTFDVSAQTVKLQITYADGKGSGTGCGVILSSDGYIVADGALISGASEIKAVFANGVTAAAEPVGSDKENGVSFLKADADGLTAARTGDLSKLQNGESFYLVDAESGNSLKIIVSDEDYADDGRYSVDRSKLFSNADFSGCLAVNASGEIVGLTVKDDNSLCRIADMTKILHAIKGYIDSDH